jgi:hypothetical protein
VDIRDLLRVDQSSEIDGRLGERAVIRNEPGSHLLAELAQDGDGFRPAHPLTGQRGIEQQAQ